MARRRRQRWRQGTAARTTATVVALATLVAAASATTAPAVASVASPNGASALVPVGPLRLADTRQAPCGCRRLDDHTIRVTVADRARIEGDVVAVAITVTALPTTFDGFVTVFPSGDPRPVVSTVNTRPDRVVANAAVVPTGVDGAIDVYGLRGGDVVIDLSAVFVATEDAAAGRFVPIGPLRAVDTRTAAPPAGALGPGDELVVPLPSGVAPDATALVVNITSVGDAAPGHLSVRPVDAPPAATSVLNTTGSGAAVAASTIVPVARDGFVVSSFGGGHVVVDVLGWFTGPSAARSRDGLFVPIAPTRLVDTRARPDRLHAGGTIELAPPVVGAAAVVTNVTAVTADAAGFVTAYPAGTPFPPTSTVNPSFWNHTVANLAITGASERGLAYTSLRGADLVVDASGWFTGTPATATGPVRPNRHRTPRVLVVGDSTLVAISLFPDSFGGFRGVEIVYDAMSCRRLSRPSCNSNVTGVTPNTAVEAILTTPGELDVVVVKTGYNDWFDDLRPDVDAVVRAARSKGAHTVLWQTYNQLRRSANGAEAMRENNRQLREIITRSAYPDVLIADWAVYSAGRDDWFWDGIHMTREGSFAQADYISRWVAAIEHRACPAPWSVGGPVVDPCVPPEWVGPVPAPELL